MAIPYRHKRALNRLGTIALILLLLFFVAWLCWVVWIQRYVVYTSNGATIDFSLSANDLQGEEATPPQAEANVSIFYNEGADAIDTTHEMTQLNGYYVTNDMYKDDIANVTLQLERLPSGTPVMIEMKGPYGSFFYPSQISGATISASTDVQAVAELVSRMKTKGFYMIAQISAFRDREFGDQNVSSGLYMLSRAGLWMDQGGMFWLDPTKTSVTSWISTVILELKEMGFDEVMLDNFCFPTSDQYIFSGDKAAALQSAAATLISTTSSSDFVLSFCVDDPTFVLPEGRCRMYLSGVNAAAIGSTAAKAEFADKESRLVFLSESADTRYDQYSVLRTLHVSEEVEARKQD